MGPGSARSSGEKGVTVEMVRQPMVSTRTTALGSLLVILVGVLNFHLPHFLLEPGKATGLGSALLELVLLANAVGALIAAVGVVRRQRWGWRLGVLIALFSFLLWIAQETVGLPGLPRQWGEPSRVVSLIVEALFVVLARAALARPGRPVSGLRAGACTRLASGDRADDHWR